jgi:hypothetical protein
MRSSSLALACLFLRVSATTKASDESLNALEAFLLAQKSLRAPRSTVRETPGTTREALRLRGGSDLVDAETTAKVMTALLTLTGLQAAVSPKSVYDQYGFKISSKKKDKRNNDVLDFIMEFNSVATLASCVLTWAMMNGADPMKGIGFAWSTWALSSLKNVKDNRAAKVGMPAWTQKFLLALNGFFAVSFATGQSYCPALGKIAAGWSLLNGLFSALRPKKFASSWGLNDLNANSVAMMKHFGYQLAAFGLLAGGVAEGNDLMKTLGYFWATYFASLADAKFISKTFADLKDGPLYVWMLLQAAVTAKLLR